MIDPTLSLVLRGTVALLLVGAALHKLRDLASFRFALSGYSLLPTWAIAPAAFLFAIVEAALAPALLLPQTAGAAALTAAALLLVYAAAIGINLARGRRHIDCGCSGPAHRQTISGALVGRNLVLAVLAMAGALPQTQRSYSWMDTFTFVSAVLLLLLLYHSIDTLIAQSRRAFEMAHD